MNLVAHDVVLTHEGRAVVDGVDVEVRAGEILAVIGPNGSGKSTLLRGLARLHPLERGTVTLDGRDIRTYGSRDMARRLAVLPQSPEGGLDLTVTELAWRGRYPHQGLMLRSRPVDYKAVSAALTACKLDGMADRPVGRLSGGERQRAWLALALAQQPKVLLLDEPTNSLDFEHQLQVMEIVSHLREQGIAVMVVLHDVGLAARYADRVVAFCSGRVAFEGKPADVLTSDALEEVFNVKMEVFRDPASGAPYPVAVGLSNGTKPRITFSTNGHRH